MVRTGAGEEEAEEEVVEEVVEDGEEEEEEEMGDGSQVTIGIRGVNRAQ